MTNGAALVRKPPPGSVFDASGGSTLSYRLAALTVILEHDV